LRPAGRHPTLFSELALPGGSVLQTHPVCRKAPIRRKVIDEEAADFPLQGGHRLSMAVTDRIAPQLAVALTMHGRISEPGGKHHRTLQKQSDIAFVRVAYSAMQLD